MKKIFFLLILFLTLLSSFSLACINSIDDFAVEVIFTNPNVEYNLEPLNKADNVLVSDNKYIFQSTYNKDVASILFVVTDQSICENCLSLRLQIPAVTIDKNINYFKFISLSPDGKLNISNIDSYNEWKIDCERSLTVPSQCEFDKGDINILAYKISENKYEALIEIRSKLNSCSNCSGGWCVVNHNLCIEKEMKDDIEEVLKFSGLISSFRNLISRYSVLGVGERIVPDLEPQASSDIDWQEAMRQQLVWLRRNNVLLITNQDIETIANLTSLGKAGQNSKIVYSNNKWLYYYEKTDAILTKILNCRGFPKELVLKDPISFYKFKISTYYLIPIVSSSILIILLVILISVARHLNKRAKK